MLSYIYQAVKTIRIKHTLINVELVAYNACLVTMNAFKSCFKYPYTKLRVFLTRF